MLDSEHILLCKVSEKWYQIIKGEYVIKGSTPTCQWSIDTDEVAHDIENFPSGSLVLYVLDRNNHSYIVGGGYFIGWRIINAYDSWNVYGIRNGVLSYDDFIQEIINQGGNEDSFLNALLLSSNFIFANKEMILIPDEFNAQCSGDLRTVISVNSEIGRYLNKLVIKRRAPHLRDFGDSWPGIYYLAAHLNSKYASNSFYSRVAAAYDFKCAVTGVRARPALEAVHIRPFYDAQFQSIQNGVLIRSDIHKLLNYGMMTFDYVNDDELYLVVSNKLESIWAEDYLYLNGAKVYLPQDRDLWPSRENVKWHQDYLFESWLRSGYNTL